MRILIYAVNAILLLLILRYEYNSTSDKTIIISSLAFVVLLTLNVLLGVFAQMDKNPVYRHYYYSVVGLLTAIVLLMVY